MMAKNTATPKAAPRVASSGKTKKDKYDQAAYQQNLFMVMALNMSWQLAIVVIIPLVGGYKLDQHFDTTPIYTVIGLIIAFLGTLSVLYRVLKESKRRAVYDGQEDKK